MTESFETKHNGIPVLAYFDDEGRVTRVVTAGTHWEFRDLDLEKFAQEHDYEIQECLKEIEQEANEYRDHIRSMTDPRRYV